jgi:CHAT domain-containing protein
LEGSPNSSEHLGTADMARLLEEFRQRPDTALNAADFNPHLAACATCREQFEDLASLERQLTSLRSVKSGPREGDCPRVEVWREIACAPTPAGETLVYIEHASRCDHCGPLLRDAVSESTVLNGELSEEERERIASLESAHARWQQKLAQRIAGTQHSKPDRESPRWWQRWPSGPRLAMAGAALLALVGVGLWMAVHQGQLYQSLFQRNQPATADRFLASAYTEQRTLELRIAGADYAPLRVSRGPAASFTSKPPSLLKAEALIAAQVVSHPSDPSWLQAQAQADMLEGKYDAAVETLRRSLELEPNSPALLTDLATAYFERAQSEGKKDDLGAAYEYLSQALKLLPDDPVALFNRAVVAGNLFLFQQALDDWEHYLRVDPASEWAEEARNRANAVREKLKDHQSKAKPLLTPAQVADAATSTSLSSEVDERVEEYLNEAVRSWLPQAFPEAGTNQAGPAADPHTAQALFFLADLTSRQHGDHWLADLLRGSSATRFPQAVTALARAAKANSTASYDVSLQQADLAEHLFRASGNTAGVLRAQFEQTFTAQMTRHSEDCQRRATTEVTGAERDSYRWLQIQFELEKSVCSALMEDIGDNEKAARRAMERAQQSGYGALYLRALGFLVGNRRYTGDAPAAARLVSEGLALYWAGQSPPKRGFNLYVELAYMAQSPARPHLKMAAWREATSLIDSDENLLSRAMTHQEMGDAAIAARAPEVAEQQYAQAALLFAAAPQTEAHRNDHLENEIRAAQLESLQDQPDRGIARLIAIQDQVRELSNNYILLMFYSTLGELQLHQHQEAEAEQSFGSAMAMAEQSLATLNSEVEREKWSKNAAPAYLAVSEAELVQGRSEEALETYERYLGAPQRAAANHPLRSRDGSLVPDPAHLATRLPLLAKQTVLSYAVLPDGLAIWVYDDRGVQARWIPKPTDGLQELGERFHDLASDPKSEVGALRRDARSLYEALIAPVESYLMPGRTLVIEADGWMSRVPFEALLDSNDHYLIERAPIVHSLGQDSQARLRSDAGISRDLSALVVGSTASSAEDGLIPLPDVAGEADAVASGFHPARLLKGGEATLRAVRSELPGVSVFHFAGHALVGPERTGLLLAGNSEGGQANTLPLMDAAVIRQLQLQSLQLAVLSACNTASGSGGSSGFDSVTDALLRAGVPHVVASRWAVDSAESQRFVMSFYDDALSGQSVSEAVRRTSRSMLANPRTSHPYYWSAFAAYGRP